MLGHAGYPDHRPDRSRFGGELDIFTVNYGVDGEGIILRTNAGRKMAAADGGEIAFEIDYVDPISRCGWSVVFHGTARDITRFDAPARRLAAQP
jgi:hypothetical protein